MTFQSPNGIASATTWSTCWAMWQECGRKALRRLTFQSPNGIASTTTWSTCWAMWQECGRKAPWRMTFQSPNGIASTTTWSTCWAMWQECGGKAPRSVAFQRINGIASTTTWSACWAMWMECGGKAPRSVAFQRINGIASETTWSTCWTIWTDRAVQMRRAQQMPMWSPARARRNTLAWEYKKMCILCEAPDALSICVEVCQRREWPRFCWPLPARLIFVAVRSSLEEKTASPKEPDRIFGKITFPERIDKCRWGKTCRS